MTLSLREHTSHPIALATDPELAARSRELYPRVFDEVTLLPSRFRGRARKYGTAEASPFEETMFVDADCIVLGSLDHLWSSLEHSDLAMVGSPLTAEEDENHHGFSTRWLIRRFGLERYMKTNSGLFCFRRSAAVEIMEECLECFLNEARPQLRRHILLGRWLGDEIAFGIIGGRRGLRTLPVPSPMYWPQRVRCSRPACAEQAAPAPDLAAVSRRGRRACRRDRRETQSGADTGRCREPLERGGAGADPHGETSPTPGANRPALGKLCTSRRAVRDTNGYARSAGSPPYWASCSFAKAPPSSTSSSHVPCSTTRPSFMTRIRSESRIVERRWAISMRVRPFAR